MPCCFSASFMHKGQQELRCAAIQVDCVVFRQLRTSKIRIRMCQGSVSGPAMTTLRGALAELESGNTNPLDAKLGISYQRGGISGIAVGEPLEGFGLAALVAWIHTVSSCMSLHVFHCFGFFPQEARAGRCCS